MTIGNSLNLNSSVNKTKAVLFGGATGDTGKYTITGDTYALDLATFEWTKLEGKYVSTHYYFSSRNFTIS
jgi:hypothetical protein